MLRFQSLDCIRRGLWNPFTEVFEQLFFSRESGMKLFLLLLLMVTLPSTEAALPSTCLMTRKPEFTGAPRVKQTSLNSVRVSWDDLVSNLECAKQFKVMWWVEGTSPPRQQR